MQSTPIGAPPGAPYTRSREISLLGLGMVGTLSQGLLPVLLGRLGAEKYLSDSGIGEAAAIESYALTLMAALAGLLFPPKHLRPIAFVAALFVVAVNLAIPALRFEYQILIARGVAGIAEGLLFWIALEAIARSPVPEWGAGLMNSGALFAAFVAANLINVAILPSFGISGAFWLVALISSVALVLALVIPRRLPPLTGGAGNTPMPRIAGWLSLLAVGLFNAAGMGFAIYLVPLATQSGLSEGVAGTALVALIIGQLAGSLGATAIAGRVAPFTVLMVSTLAYLATWPFYATSMSQVLFVFLSGALGLITFVAFPFQFPFCASVDPGTRTEVLVGPGCMLGASTGPLLSAWVVGLYGLGGLLYLAFALLFAAVALIIGLRAVRRTPTLIARTDPALTDI